MGVQYIGDAGPDGTVFGRSGKKMAFFGVTTATTKQAVVTTVDSTTITTVATAAITTAAATTNTTFQGLIDTKVRNQALAINRLIADSRSNAKAIDQLITKTRSLGLFASS